MKEILEFRIFDNYYYLLSKPNPAVYNGSIYILHITKDDPLFEEIHQLNNFVKRKHDEGFAMYIYTKRIYTKKELDEAELFYVKIKPYFEPVGEECGTIYDETVACPICKAGRKQMSHLILKRGSIPKKDIARTIAGEGEVVLSAKFKSIFEQRGLKGISFNPVMFGKNVVADYYQLNPLIQLDIADKTVTGMDPWNFPESSEGGEYMIQGYKIEYESQVFKCPKGHIVGANLLSEAYIKNSPLIKENDFFATRQKIGSKLGVIYPDPIYLCSPAFRNMVLEEKLKGFDFEVAHIE